MTMKQKAGFMQRSGQFHLVGVGGVGMNALAQILAFTGASVSGSDRAFDTGQAPDVFRKLQVCGVRLLPQDGSGIHAALTGVVFSSAVEDDNPDLAAARRMAVPLLHRAELLAELAGQGFCVAVAGTAGKTTVTGMLGWLLTQLGADPTVVNGGALLNWVTPQTIGNVRAGRSNLWVVEVDESDRSLLRFHPDWAVITNVSKDHFERDEVERLLRAFVGQVRLGVVGWGSGADDCCDGCGFAPQLSADGFRFDYGGTVFDLPLLGRHNAVNALQSIRLCERLGYAPAQISAAFLGFKGLARRLERIEAGGGITVLDDYAHNPAKIQAAWRAVAPYHRRVLALWRPHGFAPLALMLRELVHVFALLAGKDDRILVLPVYYAGGTAQRAVTSETLVHALRERGVAADYLPGYAEALALLGATVSPGDAVLFMGARDPEIGLHARRFVAQIT